MRHARTEQFVLPMTKYIPVLIQGVITIEDFPTHLTISLLMRISLML